MRDRIRLNEKKLPSLGLGIGAALILLLIVGQSFSTFPVAPIPITTSMTTVLPGDTATPAGVWFGLLRQTPIAYATALPYHTRTFLDGTYAKLDRSWPQWWACRRCADYRPAGGIWKLQFDQGIMRIYYDVTAWRSIASFTISGDRLFIFNDPYCPQDVGEYTWKLEDGNLNLEVVDDPCSIQLRGKNLSKQPWLSCLPPTVLAATSDQWHKPTGCEQIPVLQATTSPLNQQFTTIVHGGDARHFAQSPDVFANANSEESSLPEGIRVTSSEDSISYGLNRVLWGENVWIQASTDLSFNSMGIQFLGDYTLGWARVLFDDVEVWRGDTSTIWSHLGRHGGYIEISGFDPGRHTIRAESLGIDYHPVTVAYFGFSHQGGVKLVDYPGSKAEQEKSSSDT